MTQFLDIPEQKGRLVVIPEDEWLLLKEIVSTARIAQQQERHPTRAVPNAIAAPICAGHNPVTVLRQWRGLTGRKLATLAEVTPSMISQIENTGKTGSVRTLQKIATILGVPIDLLFPETWANLPNSDHQLR